MDRRRYPQQQYVPPEMVDFGQMDFGHDIIAQQMPGILQNYQQRWDMQDAAIAKLLEEQAGTQMLEGDAQAVGNLLKDSFDGIDTLVKEKYQGDRGAAAMDIVKRLSAAKAPLAQAKAEKEKYDKAFAEYQNAAQRGQAPKTFIPGEGYKTLDFETYHSLQEQQAFGEKGYTPRSYNSLRGASDLSGYLDKGISKKLSSRVWQDILKENEKTPGYLEQITRKGYTGEQLEKYFDPKNFDQDAFVKELVGEVPHLAKEFENASPEELFDYAKGIIKSQVSEQLARDYKKDLDYTPNPSPESTTTLLPSYNRPLDVKDNTSKINKIAENTSRAVQSTKILTNTIDALSVIDSTLGINSQGITSYKPYELDLSNPGLKEVNDRLEAGKGTLLDATAMWNARLSTKATHTVQALAHTINEMGKSSNLSSQPLHIIGNNINSFIGPIVPENVEGQEKRQSLLSLLWLDEEKRDKYGLTQNENGAIDFKPANEFGSKIGDINEGRRIQAIHGAREDIAKIIKGGFKNLDKKINKELEKVTKFFNDNPIAAELAEHFKNQLKNSGITDEGELTSTASQMAIEATSNTLRNNAAVYNKELSLSNIPKNPTEKNIVFGLFSNRIIRNPQDAVLQSSYRRNKGKEGELKKEEASELFAESNIQDITVVPVEGRISLLLNKDNARYEMDIESIAPADHLPTIQKAKRFMERVTNLSLYEKDSKGKVNFDSPTENVMMLDGKQFTHLYGIDPKTNSIVSTIIDERGNPAEAEFLNTYTQYIYKIFQ